MKTFSLESEIDSKKISDAIYKIGEYYFDQMSRYKLKVVVDLYEIPFVSNWSEFS